MRSDMWKVIVERPRSGGGRGRRQRDRQLVVGDDGDDLDRIGPMRPPRDRTKWLNENLSPLKRFIHAQIGRPWSNVYSEMRAHVRFENAVQQHVLVHLDQIIARNARIVDGVVWDMERAWRPLPLPHGALYVCPKSDIVKRVRVRVRDHALPPVNRVIVDASTQFHRVDGIWFEVRTVETQRAHVTYDVLLRRNVVDDSAALHKLYGRWGVHAIWKRQLSKNEIRRHVEPLLRRASR